MKYLIKYVYIIVINYINLFVFDDEIEMKNRSTIQTLTFVQTNPVFGFFQTNLSGFKHDSVFKEIGEGNEHSYVNSYILQISRRKE
jgi:hypothetical protein